MYICMNHHDVTDAMKSIEHPNMEGWDKVDNTDGHYSESFVSVRTNYLL